MKIIIGEEDDSEGCPTCFPGVAYKLVSIISKFDNKPTECKEKIQEDIIGPQERQKR